MPVIATEHNINLHKTNICDMSSRTAGHSTGISNYTSFWRINNRNGVCDADTLFSVTSKMALVCWACLMSIAQHCQRRHALKKSNAKLILTIRCRPFLNSTRAEIATTNSLELSNYTAPQHQTLYRRAPKCPTIVWIHLLIAFWRISIYVALFAMHLFAGIILLPCAHLACRVGARVWRWEKSRRTEKNEEK